MSTEASITPNSIMQLGLGFWGSKTLLSAIELGLFTELAGKPLGATELAARLVHSADERVPVEDLEFGLDFLRHTAVAICGAQQERAG